MTMPSHDARPTGEPPAEFDLFQFVVLRFPETTPDLDAEAVDRLQAEHLGYLFAMQQAGLLKVAGPLSDQPDETWRGLCLYQVSSLEEARRLAEEDPAVRAGALSVEVMTWHTPKGWLVSSR